MFDSEFPRGCVSLEEVIQSNSRYIAGIPRLTENGLMLGQFFDVEAL
jgi:hypothetical protein